MADTCPKCGAAFTADRVDRDFEGMCPNCLADFASGKPGEDPEPAPSIPNFEIIERIGRGGMGTVYRARQPGLDRDVALKVLPSSLAEDPEFVERFNREARALAALSHPNIVAVYDFGSAGGRYYIAMEYVDGMTLRQALQEKKLQPKDAFSIVPQLCDALEFAHRQGIVHRDIKPENILLDRQGRVKIADFGIARIAGKKAETITGSLQVIGTMHYMAPEQYENPKAVDHRADIYSMGVVFYEMLTGELPIGRFAPPSRKVELDVRFDEVVLKTLEKQPERRYQHAQEVGAEVNRIAGTKPPRSASRVGWIIFSVAAGILVMLLLLGGLGILGINKYFEKQEALKRADKIQVAQLEVEQRARELGRLRKRFLDSQPNVRSAREDLLQAEAELARLENRAPITRLSDFPNELQSLLGGGPLQPNPAGESERRLRRRRRIAQQRVDTLQKLSAAGAATETELREAQFKLDRIELELGEMPVERFARRAAEHFARTLNHLDEALVAGVLSRQTYLDEKGALLQNQEDARDLMIQKGWQPMTLASFFFTRNDLPVGWSFAERWQTIDLPLVARSDQEKAMALVSFSRLVEIGPADIRGGYIAGFTSEEGGMPKMHFVIVEIPDLKLLEDLAAKLKAGERAEWVRELVVLDSAPFLAVGYFHDDAQESKKAFDALTNTLRGKLGQ